MQAINNIKEALKNIKWLLQLNEMLTNQKMPTGLAKNLFAKLRIFGHLTFDWDVDVGHPQHVMIHLRNLHLINISISKRNVLPIGLMYTATCTPTKLCEEYLNYAYSHYPSHQSIESKMKHWRHMIDSNHAQYNEEHVKSIKSWMFLIVSILTIAILYGFNFHWAVLIPAIGCLIFLCRISLEGSTMELNENIIEYERRRIKKRQDLSTNEVTNVVRTSTRNNKGSFIKFLYLNKQLQNIDQDMIKNIDSLFLN